MRLNIDCICDILLCVESYSAPGKPGIMFIDNSSAEIYGKMSISRHQATLEATYTQQELIYHLTYCLEAGLLLAKNFRRDDRSITICDLTVEGHKLLDLIRPRTFLEALKKELYKTTSNPGPALIQIAASVVTNALKPLASSL